jgi:hypothetical protein
VKIDVEGYELEAVSGLSTSIPLLSLEYHLTKSNSAIVIQAISRLSAHGQLQFNLLPDKAKAFHWPKFVDSDTFFSIFPAGLATEDAFFGDIFISMRVK